MTDYVTLDDVRGLHADVMRRTGFLPASVRDLGALESAIMRPQMVAHYEGADLLTQAVTLLSPSETRETDCSHKEILDEKDRVHRRR